MKNIAFIFSILLMGFSANANSTESENNLRRGYNGDAYIFVEGDVEFSVFPDGQFDFVYVGPQTGSQVVINTPNVNVSFNSGYDYEAYVQYDDYGAVIQVEDVPVYYDEYGRIVQAGNVDIQYNDRRVVRVGGLHVIYNNYGYFSHSTGVINVFNPYYVYRPWHAYYARPIYNHCVVYDMPYRRYYSPVRYSYHDHVVYYKKRNHVAYHNGRRDFYRPGSRVYDKKGRASVNKDYNPNRTNTMVASNNGRNNSSIRKNNVRSNTVTRSSSTNSKGATRVDRNTRNSGNVSRTNTITSRGGNTSRSNDSKKVSTDRTVQKQQTRSVSSNSKNSSAKRNTTQAPKRETASRSTVNKSSAPSRGNSSAKTSRSSSAKETSSRGGRG
ncbi:hypothetical protein [Aequorivita sp. CIP111184]|uniref:hypothetical protein n=1 Tax=Aequorivita sp. CIP111184 TaxID=2211356 RepID=UPI000DBC00EF|nr:hypothetical protein [Aequorivita sp. CIP111184]SRX56026.1 hypothetical protein AEQU1_03052 [Aequorivita sp. CIP111184]